MIPAHIDRDDLLAVIDQAYNRFDPDGCEKAVRALQRALDAQPGADVVEVPLYALRRAHRGIDHSERVWEGEELTPAEQVQLDFYCRVEHAVIDAEHAHRAANPPRRLRWRKVR